MLKEFKEFALRGNMIDLAIGVVLGTAFGAVVASLVSDLITPLLGLLGSRDFSDQFLVLRPAPGGGTFFTPEEAAKAGAITLNYGSFLDAVIRFLTVAGALFFVVKGMNRLRREPPAETPAPPAPSPEAELLAEIRDLLRARA